MRTIGSATSRLMELLAFLAFGAFAAGSSAGAEPPQNCYVLAIGINKYKDKSIPELRGAVKDAEAVAELFRRQGPGVTVKTLLDEPATAAAIHSALRDIEAKAQPGDRVVVYLSSHGERDGNRFGFVSHDAITVAADGEAKAKLNGIEMNMVLFTMTLERLAQGREVVLIIDACHAGQVLTNMASALNRKADGGLVLLASSAAGQYSLDGPDNGRFTAALIEALQGRADADEDGAVTLKEIRRYLPIKMRGLQAEPFRLPGMPLLEQDFVCDASYSIPETLTLTRPNGKIPPAEPAKWLPVPESKLKDAAGVAPGTWRWARTLKKANGDVRIGEDGKPLQQTFILDFRENGIYTAEFSQGKVKEVGVGKWKKDSAHASDINLVFGGGTDCLRVEAVTAESLQISVYLHGSFTLRTVKSGLGFPFPDPSERVFDSRRPPVSYAFERVKEKK